MIWKIQGISSLPRTMKSKWSASRLTKKSRNKKRNAGLKKRRSAKRTKMTGSNVVQPT